ncbi:MAG: DUF2252 domain-containing protein [Cyanobium sp.]
MSAQPPQPILRGASQAAFLTREERLQAGKRLRRSQPREAHGSWRTPPERRDPIAVLEESNHDRLHALIPIRYGRMLRSPFTFLRGSAALMAHDLASTPTLGISVQACGDCHLLNFGLFATPERNLVFDINDFDETHPAPWEWDIKRLATSFVIAGQDRRLADEDCEAIARECVRSYRVHLRRYSQMSPVAIWYSQLDEERLIAMAPDSQARQFRKAMARKARQRVIDNVVPKFVSTVGGRHRLVEQPPILYRPHIEELEATIREGLESYRDSLADERRVLFDRYRLDDVAVKVVGIGSVGTRCLVALFFSEENHPLILQFKEARPSVLEPYTHASHYSNQGQRVVVGQRLTQSSSDLFLGWLRGRSGHDFYVRQLRDMKMSLPIDGLSAVQLKRYAEICGWTLARSHAKSGDGTTISGYLGKGDAFDRALGRFALAYADQTERDHAALVEAVNQGRIEAVIEADL